MESNFSDVSVCNSGLLKVGALPISSFSDNTRASNICQAQYPILRDEVMRNSPWRFALVQVVMATPNATAPLFDYQAAYDIPANILRVWQVDDYADAWTEIGNQIFCNKADGINTLCIYQNTDPTSWDAQFAEALAWRMAQEIAFAMVQSAPMAQEMAKGYDKSLATARSTNAIVGSSTTLIIDAWSRARKYSYGQYAVAAGAPELYGP